MKRIIVTLILAIAYLGVDAQTYGNEIQAKDNPGVIGKVKRNGDALKVWDSAANAKLTTLAAAVTSNKVQVDVISMPSTTVTATNLSTNVAQINGVTPLMGAGNTGTGSLRVTVATDQAALPVTGTFWQATQPVSLTSTTITGSVAVTGTFWQATQPVSGTVALSTTTIDVKSTTTPVNTMNSASANSGVNAAIAGLFDDTSPTSITENSFGFVRMSANHNMYGTIRDAAGNERGANVNASNELLVALSSVPSHAVTLTSTTITGTVAVTKSGTWNIDNTTFDTKSTTAPVNTMNSASANSGVNSAMAALFDDTSPTAITENSFGFLRMSTNHNLYGTIRDAAGNERGANVTSSNELLVSIGSTTAITPGTGATNLGKLEDGGHTTGDVGVMGLTVRTDAPSALAGAAEYQPLISNSVGGLWTSEVATPDQSGYDKYYVVSAASTNAANIKATPGKVYGWYVFNANAAARKIMFHNTAGTPTAGASTFFPLVIPAGSGANVFIPAGINFSTGIGITMVTGTADSDATGVAAGDLIITILYK